MRKKIGVLAAALLLLTALTFGASADVSTQVVIPPETDTFTVTVPVAAGSNVISGAQIYFKLSDNLTLEKAELDGVPGASKVQDADTVGFYYMSTKTYSGDGGSYLLTFKFSDKQPGTITFTERKYVIDLGAGKVQTIKETEQSKLDVYRVPPAASQPAASQPAASQPAASQPAASQPAASQPTGSAPASSPIASAPTPSAPAPSAPTASNPGTTSRPGSIIIDLPEQTRPDPTVSDVEVSGSTESTVTPGQSEPVSSDAAAEPGTEKGNTALWVAVGLIVLLAVVAGGVWFWMSRKDPEEK